MGRDRDRGGARAGGKIQGRYGRLEKRIRGLALRSTDIAVPVSVSNKQFPAN